MALQFSWFCLQEVQELGRLNPSTRKDQLKILRSERSVGSFPKHSPKVCSYSEIPSLVQLFVRYPGPFAEDLAAFYLPPKNEHNVGMTMVCPTGSVLAGRPAKLRHRYQ